MSKGGRRKGNCKRVSNGELGRTNLDLVSGGDQQTYVDHTAAAATGGLGQVIGRITAIVQSHMPEVAYAASLEELRAIPSKALS